MVYFRSCLRETARTLKIKQRISSIEKIQEPEIYLRCTFSNLVIRNESDEEKKAMSASLERLSSENDFSSEMSEIQFLESLILAQDERWRRA